MSKSDYLHYLIPELKPYEVFDYYDGPRFYSCKDKVGQLFIIYWVEQTNDYDAWLYLRISSERYNLLKNGNLAIATVLAEPEENFAYLVQTSGKKYFVDELEKYQILSDWLPEASDRLNIPSTSLPEKNLSAQTLASSTMRQVLELAFERMSNTYEMGCGKLGKLLDATQNTIYALSCDQKADVRRIPEEIKYKSEFLVTSLFASSFGVRLQSRTNDIFDSDKVAAAAQNLAELLTNSFSPEIITEDLKNYNVLTRSRFKHLIRTLVDSEVSIKTDWGSPSGKSITSKTSHTELLRTLKALEKTDQATTQKVERNGKLVGVDVESDFFAIMLEDKEIIKGRLAKSLVNHHFEIPSRIVATLEETCAIDPLTEREKWSYILVDISNSN